MWYGSKVIANNVIWRPSWRPSWIMKNPRGGHLYTRWILDLHGLEYSKMQRNDCNQTLQGFGKKWACATGLKAENSAIGDCRYWGSSPGWSSPTKRQQTTSYHCPVFKSIKELQSYREKIPAQNLRINNGQRHNETEFRADETFEKQSDFQIWLVIKWNS